LLLRGQGRRLGAGGAGPAKAEERGGDQQQEDCAGGRGIFM